MLVQSSSSSSLFVVDVASRTQKIHSRRTSDERLHHCADSRRRRDTSTIGISISFRSALRSDRGKIEKTQSHNGREYFDRMHAERSDTHFSFNNPSCRFDPLPNAGPVLAHHVSRAGLPGRYRQHHRSGPKVTRAGRHGRLHTQVRGQRARVRVRDAAARRRHAGLRCP